jgi:hypothetical protein
MKYLLMGLVIVLLMAIVVGTVYVAACLWTVVAAYGALHFTGLNLYFFYLVFYTLLVSLFFNFKDKVNVGKN